MLDQLLEKLRQYYSSARLTTDLLSTQDGNYVVKASIWLGTEMVITAMAADTQLENAEDRACTRALSRLGLAALAGSEAALPPKPTFPKSLNADPLTFPKPPVGATPPRQFQDNSGRSPLGERGDAVTSAPADILSPEEKESIIPSLSELDIEPTVIPAYRDGKPDEVPAQEPGLNRSSYESSTTDLDLDPMVFSQTPVDLSDIIAQTDVELKRLGWSVGQGREYLEKKYGKRSRHDLTDEELLEFLLYLETQPAATEG